MSVVFLLQEDKIYLGVATESRDAGQQISGGLRETKGEECSTRIVSAEKELRRVRLEEWLMITLNEYKVRVRNLDNWEEQEQS